MCISKSLNELLNRKKRLEEILSGQYDYIIDTDMDSIKNAIESGKLPENNALSKLHVFFKDQLLYSQKLKKKKLL